MRGKPIETLVYEQMFPKPRASDPPSFHALLQRSLILEVRSEVHSFYGHLDTPEAKYPGLDYCHPTHRIRLGRWPWHRRLFRAFDALRLTPAEIAGLTKWEGTRWAKERYEKEQGVAIRDTAADDMPHWGYGELEARRRSSLAGDAEDKGTVVADLPTPTAERVQGDNAVVDDLEDDFEDEEEDDEDRMAESDDEDLLGVNNSVGNDLNERLMDGAARREAGEPGVVLDEEWEQWLKNVLETGEPFPLLERFPGYNAPATLVPSSMLPQRMLSAARAGLWREIPEPLRDVIRRTIEAETGVSTAAARRATGGPSGLGVS